MTLTSASVEITAPELVAPTARLDFVPFTPSLGPLIEFWEGLAQQPQHPLYSQAVAVTQAARQHPQLSGPLTEELKETHAEQIRKMLSAIFPEGLQRFSFSAVATPGTFDIHYATPRFHRELCNPEGQLYGRLVAASIEWERLGKLFGCLSIARKYYNLDIDFQSSVIYEVVDADSGLKRYYQMRVHLEHMRQRGPERLEPLSAAQIKQLRRHLADIEVWQSIIPFHLFENYGFIVLEATDITEEHVLASIQQELVAKDCLRDRNRLLSLQQHLRELLRIPDLLLAVPIYYDSQVLVFSPNEGEGSTTISEWMDDACAFCPDEESDVYESCCEETRIMDDLLAEKEISPCAQDLKDMGMRASMTLPLTIEGETIGSMVCCCPRPGVFNLLTPVRLNQVLPQLAWAAQRTMDTVEAKIQSVMKERFTALHPSVEWRFRQDAVAVVKGEEKPEDILFANLYPLFGTSDVRDSTVLRNRAIVADLVHQLRLADEVIEVAQAARPLAYLDSLRFRIATWIGQLSQGLSTGDESRAVEFLKNELEPLFQSLRSTGYSVGETVQRYEAALESRLGLVYKERKLYESSMSLVRETAAEVLTAAQVQAQADYPHLFEMHKTDGVDHTMYIGDSLVRTGGFDLLYLRNLRLWQLQTMVEVVRKTREVTQQMELKMDTAHLILVQDSPITIRFSLEDKQFNVDGSYNARYEILKKRIDKAEVRETGERLTQPGKLAIVYSHPREAGEYQRYCRYLASQGSIEDAIEDLELAALQGVSGLKALRLQVVSRSI